MAQIGLPLRIARRLGWPARLCLRARAGYRYGRSVRFVHPGSSAPPITNRLEEYFDSHIEGPGLWKWRHYFEVYDRHLVKFVGKKVNVLEIGVYSGGSLGMWRAYFGPGCCVHGVDIASECKTYEGESVKISIGDQADPGFWAKLLPNLPRIDVVIDDGGHLPHQQVVTLEALLPHISPGGVYVCEDVHGAGNEFHAYVSGLASNLHTWNPPDPKITRTTPTEFQRMIRAVHLYPFLVVMERAALPREELVAPRHGTEWQPFLDTEPAERSPATKCRPPRPSRTRKGSWSLWTVVGPGAVDSAAHHLI